MKRIKEEEMHDPSEIIGWFTKDGKRIPIVRPKGTRRGGGSEKSSKGKILVVEPTANLNAVNIAGEKTKVPVTFSNLGDMVLLLGHNTPKLLAKHNHIKFKWYHKYLDVKISREASNFLRRNPELINKLKKTIMQSAFDLVERMVFEGNLTEPEILKFYRNTAQRIIEKGLRDAGFKGDIKLEFEHMI